MHVSLRGQPFGHRHCSKSLAVRSEKTPRAPNINDFRSDLGNVPAKSRTACTFWTNFSEMGRRPDSI